jgi:hypothetical protein
MHVYFQILFVADEGDKVELIMRRFTALPASSALDNALMKLVGRVVLAGSPFYAPANFMVLNFSTPVVCFIPVATSNSSLTMFSVFRIKIC